MSEVAPRFWEIFFEVFEALPRQGPGNRESAAKALARCDELPASPRILDLGCGVGGQTFHLAELTAGSIFAIDTHAPSVERLNAAAAAQGLAHRVRAEVRDMADAHLSPASFDLIWSEGALYNIGIQKALVCCRDLLCPGGYLVFTDAVWRKADPPAAVKAMFAMECPEMGGAEDVVRLIAASGFECLDHFTLPDKAWWDDFYTPMQHRITELRGVYHNDPEALALLDQIAEEPELHRRYSDYYAYEFFIARRP